MKTLKKKYLLFIIGLRFLIFSVRMGFSIGLQMFKYFNTDKKKYNAKAE